MPKTKRNKPVRRRRQRMGGFDLGSDVSLAILVIIGVGGYALYNWLEGDSGSEASGQGVPAVTNTLNQVNTDLQSQVSAGDGPNYDATQYGTWATAILNAGSTVSSTFFSQPSVVLAIMDQMDNLADIYSLITAFGTQTSLSWVTGTSYTLPAYIRAAFNASDVTSFNQQLAYNNVDYSF